MTARKQWFLSDFDFLFFLRSCAKNFHSDSTYKRRTALQDLRDLTVFLENELYEDSLDFEAHPEHWGRDFYEYGYRFRRQIAYARGSLRVLNEARFEEVR